MNPVRKTGLLTALLSLAMLLPAGCSEDSLPGLLSQAEDASRAGDLRAAAVYYGTASAEAPEDDFVRWQLVKLLLTLRDGAAAEKQIRAASALGVDDDRTRPALAQALLLQGRHREVVDLSPDGLGKSPAAVVLAYQCRALIALGQLESAAELLHAATRRSRYLADVAFAEAELALHRQDLDGALAALRNVRLLEPDYPYAAARLGEIALVRDDIENAERYFNEAVELRYGTWRDLLNRGIARLRQGKIDDARDDARRLLASESARPEVQSFARQVDAGQWDAESPRLAMTWQPRLAVTASAGTALTPSPPMRGQPPALDGGSAVAPVPEDAAPLSGRDPAAVTAGNPEISAADQETPGSPTVFGRPSAEAIRGQPESLQTAAGQGQDSPVVVRAALSAPEPPEATAAVTATVQAWADAWSRQDVDDYLSRYAADFRPADGTSRTTWVEQRRERLTRPQSISIELSGLKVTMLDADHAQVSFVQDYRASHYRDRVDKRLGLRFEGGAWKILSETSR